MKPRWILGSFIKDFAFLTLPGLLMIAFAAWTRDSQEWAVRAWVVFVVYTCLDSGHVYTTLWRTYLQPAERRERKWLYLLTPFAFGGVFAMWVAFQIPGLWQVIVYGTLFHNFRQLWGFLRWYEKLEGRKDPLSFYFFHALVLVPVVAFHFNPYRPPGYYYTDRGEMFHWPQESVYLGCLVAYFSVSAVWGAHEIQNWTRGLREPGRLLGLLTAIVLYGYGPLLGRSFGELILPLIASHGIAYIAVMGQSTARLGHTRWKTFKVALVLMFATAVFLGLLDKSLQDYLVDTDLSYLDHVPGWGLVLATALSLGPLYSHYLFDAFLWRKSHRDAAIIFAGKSAGED